jgi:glycosyltransferase involved in cell wall biosynthesis
MRIVLDLQGAQSFSRYAGIGRYSLALAEAIVRQAGQHEVWICLSRAFGDSLQELRQSFADLLPPERIVAFDIVAPTAASNQANAWRTSASELLREAFLRQLAPDLVYVVSLIEGWSDDCVTSIGRLPADHVTATTLYDLIPLVNPTAYLSDASVQAWYMDKVASLRKADLLLAISDYAHEEALQVLGTEARIVTISSAASPMFRPVTLEAAALTELRNRYG